MSKVQTMFTASKSLTPNPLFVHSLLRRSSSASPLHRPQPQTTRQRWPDCGGCRSVEAAVQPVLRLVVAGLRDWRRLLAGLSSGGGGWAVAPGLSYSSSTRRRRRPAGAMEALGCGIGGGCRLGCRPVEAAGRWRLGCRTRRRLGGGRLGGCRLDSSFGGVVVGGGAWAESQRLRDGRGCRLR
nr:hypothetical protein Iba_chr14eCG2100 [Ipomoea batatas]